MLDAGAAGLALGLLDANEFVQAGANFSEIDDWQADAQPSMASTPPSSFQILPIADVDEGGVASLDLEFLGAGVNDMHVVEVDWGDGTPLETFNVSPGSQFFSTTHQYLDDDPSGTSSDVYSINVRVLDAGGNSETASTPIAVANLAPTNLQIAPPASIDENGVAQLDLVFEDAGVLDTHTVEVDWGDGTPLETFNVSPGSQFFSTTHQYLDDDPSGTSSDVFSINVRVIDDDGGFAAGSTAVTVNNVAPSNLQIAPPAAISENGIASLDLTFDDPGTLDEHAVEVDWGDGSAIETFTVAPGSQFFSTTHQYLDDNPSGTSSDVYVIKVKVRDDDGGEVAGQTGVTVNNVAPSDVTIDPIATINENDFAVLNLAFTDPGTQDVHMVEVDWGDGSAAELLPVAAGARSFTAMHQYKDDNPTGTPSDSYTATVRVRDDDGGVSAPATATVTVNNVAPSGVVIVPLAAINENDVATLNLTFDDVGSLDSHQVEIDWGDGSAAEVLSVSAGSRFFSTTHQYVDDNPTGTPSDDSTIKVRVLDDDGGASPTATASITVNNVAPSNVIIAPLGTINENDVATLNLTFDDPGTFDTHTVEIDWGDGSAIELLSVSAGSRFFSTTHQYLDDNPTATPSDNYTVSVRIVDDDGGASAATTASITVNNVAPSNVQLAPLATINENQVATLGLTFDDPGTLDANTVEINWGDGSAVEVLSISAGARFFSTTHQYLDDNPTNTPSDSYTVSVRVLDDDGGASATATTGILVNNVTPSGVVIAPLGMIDENDVTTLQLEFEDPGTLDAHKVEIDWGDGSAVELLSASAGSRFFSTTHQYLDDNPTATPSDNYTVTVRVLDDDGGVSTPTTATVTVNNVAPFNVAIMPPASSVDEGSSVTLDFDFDDPGTQDTHTYQVDWGDGKFTSGVVAGRAFSASHIYADNGNYTVRVTVTDDDGGVGMGMAAVTVNNVAPTLTVVADQTLDEGSLLDLTNLGTFTDPGFDNPDNTHDPANDGEIAETFSFEIDWGDGTADAMGPAMVDGMGGPGVATVGSFDGMHTYADNGAYTVTVSVFDDDGGQHQQTFTVTVLNVDPTLLLANPAPTINEGSALTLGSLGVRLQDPGFDNSLNAGNDANGGETEETFEAMTVDWGDGSAPQSLMIGNRDPGEPGVFTTADFVHDPHTYADNGTYSVTIVAKDDDGEFVSLSFTIEVHNVAPTLLLTTEPLDVIDEGGTLTIDFLGSFSDPGFDNPGRSTETFDFKINWGDETETDFMPSSTRVNGSPGAPTTGTLTNVFHKYLDNDEDNKYTITVTIRDDDGDIDVEELVVTVNNVNPALNFIFALDVNTEGDTTLEGTFNDPGADSFEVWVDWGDMSGLPEDDYFVREGVVSVTGAKSFTFTHHYDGPPDPTNPAAKIPITVKVRDDDFGTANVVEPGESDPLTVLISNPGEGNKFARIDLTPRVPMLSFPARPVSAATPASAKISIDASEGGEITGSAGESQVSNERYFELRVVDLEGNDVEPGYPLPADVLDDLPALFRRLPDNTYRIYLVQTGADVERLVITVVVRNGRMIDPSDDSEGARDKPPTDEPAAAPAAEGVPVEEGVRDADNDAINEAIDEAFDDAADARPIPGRTSRTAAALRHGSTLASVALALSAAGRSWRTQVDEALAKARREQRRQLRTVGHWRRKKPR